MAAKTSASSSNCWEVRFEHREVLGETTRVLGTGPARTARLRRHARQAAALRALSEAARAHLQRFEPPPGFEGRLVGRLAARLSWRPSRLSGRTARGGDRVSPRQARVEPVRPRRGGSAGCRSQGARACADSAPGAGRRAACGSCWSATSPARRWKRWRGGWPPGVSTIPRERYRRSDGAGSPSLLRYDSFPAPSPRAARCSGTADRLLADVRESVHARLAPEQPLYSCEDARNRAVPPLLDSHHSSISVASAYQRPASRLAGKASRSIHESNTRRASSECDCKPK